jgi:predicted ATPase
VQEGSLKLGALLDRGQQDRQSLLKFRILRTMMSRSGLIEGLPADTRKAEEELQWLDLLLHRFADGKLDKLRPNLLDEVELRISTPGGSHGFDHLSSGQKEIIGTLFLIWASTREKAGIVLIDEPELHLNADWQRDFVRTLFEIAPHNQYIMATHSEEIFRSVASYQRILLETGASA